MTKVIDLGVSQAEPENMATVVEIDDPPVKINYPSLYISGRENLEDAPSTGSEGKATIEFRVISKSEREIQKNASTMEEYSLELEIKSIAFESSVKTRDEDDSQDEIEEGLKKVEAKSKKKADEEED